jgi:drug/metabolite transporter (DMT)-like permease
MSFRMSDKTKAHWLLLLVVFIWGSTFVLVKAALVSTTPLLFNLLRMALATLVLAVINRTQLRRITRTQLAAGALAGLFLGAGYQFQTFGLTLTTPAKSAFITGMVVIFVPAFTLIPAFRPKNTSRPGLFAAVGALAALAGLIYLTTPPGTTLHNLTANIAVGDVITLGCSIAFAAHLLTLARLSPGIDSGLLATLQIAGATPPRPSQRDRGDRARRMLRLRNRRRLHHPKLRPEAPSAHPHGRPADP